MLAALIFNVMDVNDVEVVCFQTLRAFVQGCANLGTRAVERVFSLASGLRILANLGRKEIAVARDAA